MIEKKIEKWQCYSGISIGLIGIIHVLAVFFIFNTGFESLSQDNFLSTIFMFISTGVAVCFTGILIVYNSNGMSHLENRAWYSLLFCSSFLILIGFGGVAIMPSNPFAWIILIVAFTQLFPLIRYGKYFQKNCRDMAYVHQVGILEDYLGTADHIDIKYYDTEFVNNDIFLSV